MQSPYKPALLSRQAVAELTLSTGALFPDDSLKARLFFRTFCGIQQITYQRRIHDWKSRPTGKGSMTPIRGLTSFRYIG